MKVEQEDDGSWFGRWGTNYVYGTWSVLCALNAAGEDMQAPYVQKAVKWLLAHQRKDGGWGEDNDSYLDTRPGAASSSDNTGSTAAQTAWALMGLMAAGEAESEAVRKGVDYLLKQQRPDGLWEDPWFNAPGFPRVFYLRYHGYSKYFPLWALARYRQSREQGQLTADAA